MSAGRNSIAVAMATGTIAIPQTILVMIALCWFATILQSDTVDLFENL